jgi:hypothetical protein
MTNKYFNSKPDSIFNAARNVLSNLNEAEEDAFSFPKNKKENYAKFLAANAKRVGKPMIDGGLKADKSNSDSVNGQPADDVIYVGSGCITFDQRGKKTFIQMNEGMFNTSDGSVSWSQFKNFSGNAYISADASEFADIAKALSIAAKL